MASGLPSGQHFDVDWSKCVLFVGVAVRDTNCRVSNGADNGDNKCRESCFGMIAVAQSALAKWEIGQEEGKGR